MAEYTETKVVLDEFAQKARTLKERKDSLLTVANQLVDNYATLQSNYSGFGAELDSDAAANPGDANWQNAKAEKDKILAEFISNKNNAIAIRDAIAAV